MATVKAAKKPVKKKLAKSIAVAAAVPLYVHYIIDSSASMCRCRDQVISGFNEYIDNLRTQYQDNPEYGEIFVGVTTFNQVVRVRPPRPLSTIYDMTPENYRPSGNTALYDAIGYSIKAFDEVLAKADKTIKPTVLMAIHTDGEENASLRYGLESLFNGAMELVKPGVKNLIAQRQEQGWTFTFLGVDIDAYSAAGNLGISQGNTYAIGAQNTDASFRVYSVGTQSLRATSSSLGGGQQSNSFYRDVKQKPDTDPDDTDSD